MKDSVRMVALVLATSACKQDTSEAAPAPAPSVVASEVEPAKPAKPAEPAQQPDPPSGGDAPADEAKPRPSAPPRDGGLTGLTLDVIAEVRRVVGEPQRLVPDAAHFVMRARPPALLAHAELAAVWAKLEGSDANVKTAVDVVRTCLGSLELVDDVVLGFDDHEHVVLVAHAEGIGTDATWRCFAREAGTRGRVFDLTITGTARGEGPQLRESEGDVGYFPDDDTVVLVSKAWDTDVQARIRGEGTAAIEGTLAGVVGRVQADRPLWVAGRITGTTEVGLASTPMAGIDDVAFELRIDGEDLVLETTADAGEAADATRMRDAIQQQLDEFKGILPMMGVPATLGPKIAFVTEGDLVSLGFTLTADELRALREKLGAM
jgi:hypothetical protein